MVLAGGSAGPWVRSRPVPEQSQRRNRAEDAPRPEKGPAPQLGSPEGKRRGGDPRRCLRPQQSSEGLRCGVLSLCFHLLTPSLTPALAFQGPGGTGARRPEPSLRPQVPFLSARPASGRAGCPSSPPLPRGRAPDAGMRVSRIPGPGGVSVLSPQPGPAHMGVSAGPGEGQGTLQDLKA